MEVQLSIFNQAVQKLMDVGIDKYKAQMLLKRQLIKQSKSAQRNKAREALKQKLLQNPK
jgi:hypothetical protein